MVVPDIGVLADHYSEDDLMAVLSALKILEGYDFYNFVINLNKQILLDGFNVESAEDLAKKILDARQTNGVLLALRDLAQSNLERD
jgi:hypothetical protein